MIGSKQSVCVCAKITFTCQPNKRKDTSPAASLAVARTAAIHQRRPAAQHRAQHLVQAVHLLGRVGGGGREGRVLGGC